jgi:hypothetical protein
MWMRMKIFTFIISLVCLLSPVMGNTGGYLSFEYTNGHKDSDVYGRTFQNAEVGIIFSGFSQGFEYTAEMSLDQQRHFRIEQAWVGYSTSEQISMKFGVYPVPFGRYNQINRPHRTILVNTPLAVEYFFPNRWKNLGVLLEGRISSIFYSTYIGNGLAEAEGLNASQTFQDNNRDKGQGGKIGLELSEGLDLAYSRYWGKYDDAGERDLRLEALDGRIVIAGIQFLYERIWGTIENPGGYPDGTAKGYSVQMNYNMNRFRPFVCYQEAVYEDRYHGPGFLKDISAGQGISLSKKRWAAGVVYFPTPNVVFKLEYDWNKETGAGRKDNVLVIQAALNF